MLVKVYRISTRREVCCTACKAHAANRYYRVRRYAKLNRAHVGCNCDVLVQKIRQKVWNAYFVRPNGTLRRVYDLRRVR
jgi:hypothetical protein